MAPLPLVVVVLAGLVGVGLWAAPHLVPADVLERRLTARVERALGGDLRIGGESRLTLLPRPTLEIGAWRTTTPVGPLNGEAAQLVFDWRALLRGETALASARLEAPRLVVVAPPPPARAAGMFAGAELGDVALTVRDGRVVLPDGDDVVLHALRSAMDGSGRRVDAEARWRDRDVTVAATFASAELRTLDLAAGRDRLGFRGRLGPDGAGAGTLALDVTGPADLVAWLPAAAIPERARALAREIDGPLRLDGEVTLDAPDWRLDEARLTTADVGLRGALDVAAGRWDARLTLDPGPPPRELLAGLAARRAELAPALARIERFALDGENLRLRLTRTGDGLAASLRAGLAGASDVTAEGRVHPDGPRFDGSITVVSDDVTAALPAALAAELPGPTPLTLTADLALDPSAAVLGDVRLGAPRVAFRGGIELRPAARPALTVDGVVDRLRLPLARLTTTAGRGAVLDRLDELAASGGAAVDLDVRRLLVDGGAGLDGRLVATLDGTGLWITAFEARGPDLGLSLTGGLRLESRTLDALGALRVDAPARLARRFGWSFADRLAAVPGGRFDLALRGALAELGVELDGRLGASALRFDGTMRPLRGNAVRGTLALDHPDAGALLDAWGVPPHPTRPLEGPATFEGTLATEGTATVQGDFRLGGLTGALRTTGRRLAVRAVAGPVADLHAVATALTPWPADLARRRARVQGDWPVTPPLATLWPAPFELELDAPDLVDAEGRAVRLDIALAGTAERLTLERFHWASAVRRYRVTGTATRGRRGVALAGELTLRDAATAPVPTALGLGWLGPGEVHLSGGLRARGTSPGELVGDLTGTLDVQGRLGPSVRRGVDGAPVTLPRLTVAGAPTIARGRFDLAALRSEDALVDGTVDLFADRLAARLTLVGDDGVRLVRATGPLDRARWRVEEPAAR